MIRFIASVAVIVFATLAAPAWGGSIEGKVQSIDATERGLTLDNGTKVWLGDSVALDSVKEGAEVKVAYEEKDGKPVATSVEMK